MIYPRDRVAALYRAALRQLGSPAAAAADVAQELGIPAEVVRECAGLAATEDVTA